MTLRVGDKVRVAVDPRHTGRKMAGTTGVVTGIGGAFGYDVTFDRRTDGLLGYAFHGDEIEKIEDQKPTPLGLRPGDKVVNLKTGREGLVLKGPISGELKVYDQKPPIRDAVPAQALEEYEFHHPGTYDVWRLSEKLKAAPW